MQDDVPRVLPKEGYLVRYELFLDDASPWSVLLVFVLPLGPLNP